VSVGAIAAKSKNALVGGPFGSDLVGKDYVDTGVPVIRGQNMSNGRWVSGEFAYVTEGKADKLASNCARPGDLIFTQRGTLGQVAIVPDGQAPRFLISQSQMKLTVDPELADPLFMYYQFTSNEQVEYIKSHSIQTGVPHTNLSILRNTPVVCPPICEQRRIASLLGALDDKIELNRRMNQTLEAMARALFKSWFVDFEPVLAKSEGRPTGLPPDLDALFPSGFEDSPGGEIPKGWRVETIADLCQQVVNGSTPSRSQPEYWQCGTIPWFRTGELEDGFLLEAKERITEAGHHGSSTKMLPRHSVVMAIYAAPTVGRLGVLSSPGTFNQAMTGMVPLMDVGPWFLFEQLYQLRSWFNERANGAAQQNISKLIVESAPVVRPSAALLAEFNRLCEPWYLSRERNSMECQALVALRDDLLPRLLSGEVEVAEAKEIAHG